MASGREGNQPVRPASGGGPALPRAPRSSGSRRDAARPAHGSQLISGEDLKAALVERARSLGFDLVRVARPESAPLAGERLAAWLAEGLHGSMNWMAATAARRGDPRALWPEVRSVILLGLNYGPAGDSLASLGLKDRGTISVYARNRDYHDLIK